MTKPALQVVRPDQDIPFIDLGAQRRRIAKELDAAVLKVVHEGKYIMGPEVEMLEAELAKWAGSKYALSCSNGTDSLGLVLMAKGVKAGDAIFVPAFTFVATAEVVAWVGATAYFVDVYEDTFNIDPASLARAVAAAKAEGLNPAGIIPVGLFGQAAEFDAINAIAAENGMWVMDDAAQSFGATYNGKPVGSLTDVTSTSFFPAKPLGCYGDGGALFTDDEELMTTLKSLRLHGQGAERYDNVRIGLNARMDTIQAAILLEKLKIFGDEIVQRQKVADRYNEAFTGAVKTPVVRDGMTSVWAQYTMLLEDGVDRKKLLDYCKDAGVPTMVYYPIPLSQQKGYMHYPSVPGGVPVSERISGRVFSVPMHPYLDKKTQDYICNVVLDGLRTVS